ncbi:hypothetical protein INR49_012145, partial [Caranx melampygus]
MSSDEHKDIQEEKNNNKTQVELVDKCIGSRIHIVMKTDKEIVGTLLGFDDFLFVELTSYCPCSSEITPEGRRITKLDQILLNGNNITMLIPGGEGPEILADDVIEFSL